MTDAGIMDLLRRRIARIEGSHPEQHGVLPFGISGIDVALPGGGLPLAALHEVSGVGTDGEFAAAPALFAAGILARQPGPVLWVVQQQDLFAPALAAAGLHPDRVIYAEAGHAGALMAMEEGLRHPGLAGVVAEVSVQLSLTASRRLHLAAKAGGTLAIILRRRVGAEGAIAAVTRWRIGPQESAPPLAHAPDTPGLGRLCWRLELTRCRGGRTGSWIVEACDGSGHLGLVSVLGDRPAVPAAFEAAG